MPGSNPGWVMRFPSLGKRSSSPCRERHLIVPVNVGKAPLKRRDVCSMIELPPLPDEWIRIRRIGVQPRVLARPTPGGPAKLLRLRVLRR